MDETLDNKILKLLENSSVDQAVKDELRASLPLATDEIKLSIYKILLKERSKLDKIKAKEEKLILRYKSVLAKVSAKSSK